MTTVERMKKDGYTCKKERVRLQGGDMECFRVRDATGKLVDPVGTHRSAAKAWTDAAAMIKFKRSANPAKAPWLVVSNVDDHVAERHSTREAARQACTTLNKHPANRRWTAARPGESAKAAPAFRVENKNK